MPCELSWLALVVPANPALTSVERASCRMVSLRESGSVLFDVVDDDSY